MIIRIEDAGTYIQRFRAETRSALASCCSTSAEGLRRPRSIWLRYGLEDAGLFRELPQRQLRRPALTGNKLTEGPDLARDLVGSKFLPCHPVCLQLQANASSQLACLRASGRRAPLLSGRSSRRDGYEPGARFA